jgi:hypothetical protein
MILALALNHVLRDINWALPEQIIALLGADNYSDCA